MAAQGFATIAAMPTQRAMHSATLLPDGKVLIAGGATDWTMAPSASTAMFDPTSFRFATWTDLTAARRSQGAILLDDEKSVLMMGGDAPSTYEIVPLSGTGGEPVYALPMQLPSPSYPNLVSLTAGSTRSRWSITASTPSAARSAATVTPPAARCFMSRRRRPRIWTRAARPWSIPRAASSISHRRSTTRPCPETRLSPARIR